MVLQIVPGLPVVTWCYLLAVSMLVWLPTDASAPFPGGGWRCDDWTGLAYHYPGHNSLHYERDAKNLCVVRKMQLPTLADERSTCLRNYRSFLFGNGTGWDKPMWLRRTTWRVCNFYPGWERSKCTRQKRLHFVCKEILKSPRKEAVCSYRSHPDNGTVSYPSGLAYPSVAAYTCNPGYQLVGHSRIGCSRNGHWRHRPPTCEGHGEIDVGMLAINASTTILCDGGFYFYSTSKAVCSDLEQAKSTINISTDVLFPDDYADSAPVPEKVTLWISHPGNIACILVIVALCLLLVALLLFHFQDKLEETAKRIRGSTRRRSPVPWVGDGSPQNLTLNPGEQSRSRGYIQVELAPRTGGGFQSSPAAEGGVVTDASREQVPKKYNYSQVVLKEDRVPETPLETSAV